MTWPDRRSTLLAYTNSFVTPPAEYYLFLCPSVPAFLKSGQILGLGGGFEKTCHVQGYILFIFVIGLSTPRVIISWNVGSRFDAPFIFKTELQL